MAQHAAQLLPDEFPFLEDKPATWACSSLFIRQVCLFTFKIIPHVCHLGQNSTTGYYHRGIIVWYTKAGRWSPAHLLIQMKMHQKKADILMLVEERKPLILLLHSGKRKHDVNKSPLVVFPLFAFCFLLTRMKNYNVRANSCQVLLSHPLESM